MLRNLALFVALAAVGCAGPEPSRAPSDEPSLPPEAPTPPDAPYVQVVGTVQDGGLPHIACTGDHCEAARSDAARRRFVASLAIVLPASGKVFLIDATPDIHEQLEMLSDARNVTPGGVDRAPLDGVFLTHAHVGHYLGLALLGYEAVHTRGLPVWGTHRMRSFLEDNGPWSLLVSRDNIRLQNLEGAVELGEGVRVEALPVPHRDEYTDTVGFVISGPERSLFYVPDTDSWQAWEPSIEQVLESVDVGILDGTFFSLDELPGRSVEQIGHPLIADSLERLAPVLEGDTRVIFTHFNHTNPVLDPESTARERVLRLGFELLDEGAIFGL